MHEPDWTDLDYLAARVHGRRSRLWEGSALDRLCQIRTLPELARALGLSPEASPLVLQRGLVVEFFEELSRLAARLPDAGGKLLAWMRVRFQAENLKVLARGIATGRSMESLQPHLFPLPKDLQLDLAMAASFQQPEDLVVLLPRGPIRASLEAMSSSDRAAPRGFFMEAVIDCGYLRELLRRAGLITGNEGRIVEPLIHQEVDTFHLGLAARGIWIHHLEPDRLLPLLVEGAGLSRAGFEAMLKAPDLSAIARRAVGKGIDALPVTIDEPDVLEALAWNRLLRLANNAFRQSHMGPGAVVAFTALRRVELANLITLSEGIRAGIAPSALRARLIPRILPEAAHV